MNEQDTEQTDGTDHQVTGSGMANSANNNGGGAVTEANWKGGSHSKQPFFSIGRPRMNAFYSGTLSAIVVAGITAGLAALTRYLENKNYNGALPGIDFYINWTMELLSVLGLMIVMVVSVGMPLLYVWKKRKRTIILTYVIELLVLGLILTGVMLMSGNSYTESNGGANCGVGVDLSIMSSACNVPMDMIQ